MNYMKNQESSHELFVNQILNNLKINNKDGNVMFDIPKGKKNMVLCFETFYDDDTKKKTTVEIPLNK